MNHSQMTDPGVTVGAVRKVTTTERNAPTGVPPSSYPPPDAPPRVVCMTGCPSTRSI